MPVTPVLRPFIDGWAAHQRQDLGDDRGMSGALDGGRLTAEIPQRRGDRMTTRGWVIWHLMEHEADHGGALSLVLGNNGSRGLDL